MTEFLDDLNRTAEILVVGANVLGILAILGVWASGYALGRMNWPFGPPKPSTEGLFRELRALKSRGDKRRARASNPKER